PPESLASSAVRLDLNGLVPARPPGHIVTTCGTTRRPLIRRRDTREADEPPLAHDWVCRGAPRHTERCRGRANGPCAAIWHGRCSVFPGTIRPQEGAWASRQQTETGCSCRLCPSGRATADSRSRSCWWLRRSSSLWCRSLCFRA